MKKFAGVLFAVEFVVIPLIAEMPTPQIVWQDVDNPSMLTNRLTLPLAFTVTGWFEADSFSDLAPILSYTTDPEMGTNGFGVFMASHGAVAAFVRSQDDSNTIFAEGVTTNAPQHFALSYSGDEATLYLNGFCAGTARFPSPQSLNWGGGLWAGVPFGKTSLPPFDGMFGDIHLYAGALTWREIATLFVSDHHAALVAENSDLSHLDADADGMPDVWELRFGLNPLDPQDAAADVDDDGMDNLEEFHRGRNPRIGVADAMPCLIHCTTEMSP